MSDQPNIFDLRSFLGAQIGQASGANPFGSVTVDLNANMIEIRLHPREAATLSAHFDNADRWRFDNADRWRNAFEGLHARLLRDLPGDASELPPPEDEYWARQLEDLLLFSGELYGRANRPVT